MVESFSTFVLVLVGIAAFLNLRDGTLGDWLRAKFFNAAAPNPKKGQKRARNHATTSDVPSAGSLQFPGGLRYPLPGAPSCGDGWHAPRPGRLHLGADLRAGAGTPIAAASSGKVVAAGAAGGYGLKVDLDHGAGLLTRYAHLSRIMVSVGQTVDGGQQIGEVGSTGNASGPHLHFEVHRDGKPVDPAPAIGVTCERVGAP